MLSLSEWTQVMLGALLTLLRVITALIHIVIMDSSGRCCDWSQSPFRSTFAARDSNCRFGARNCPVSRSPALPSSLGRRVTDWCDRPDAVGYDVVILFNVIAGAQAIPSELFEAAKVYRLSRVQRWKTLILPGGFPYLV
ncbi:hypothetical protein NDI45_24225 [Leptolyngbya sp. GB1-A1]